MTFSYYIYKIPYSLIWKISKLFRKKQTIAFYCDNELDFEVFKNINIENSYYISRNKRVLDHLKSKGIASKIWPSYPDVVIMARHAHYRFPCNNIIKIGLRHGPYHFKKMINASKYNKFDLFLMTSEKEVEIGNKLGITSAVSGGFPKLDSLLNDSINSDSLEKLSSKLKIDKNKKTLLFSATWNNSGMSAIEKWYNRLSEISYKYNILVTVHPFTDDLYKNAIRNNEETTYIEDDDLYPYMKLSDALISDTSSIIAEYCTLYKPIICFNTDNADRTDPEVTKIIDNISLKVNDFVELTSKLTGELSDPTKRKKEQKIAVKLFFDDDKPDKGEKASKIILEYIKKVRQ